MPELPEVETTVRGLLLHCQRQTIKHIIIRQPKLRWPIAPNINALFQGQRIININRRGKYILMQSPTNELIIHLGMSGSLRIVRSNTAPGKHDHFDIVLENEKSIRYNDPRRFGCLLVSDEMGQHPLLNSLGVEPLTETFDSDYLYEICQSRKANIKSIIMNSQLVVGVGNIYAQESLFLAGIHPKRAANRISKQRIEYLVENIKKVLREAIKAGGTTLKDFTSADGKPGYFQQTLNIYGRAGKDCVNCQTQLKQITLNQRTTTYCSHCQK